MDSGEGRGPRTPIAPTPEEILGLNISQAAHAVGAGRRYMYKEISSGKLKAVVMNRRGDLRIRREWLIEWLESLPLAGSQGEPHGP